MRNPLRSESEAFRFLLVVIVGALVIVAGATVNTWLGVAAAVVVVIGIIWWLMQEALPGTVEPAHKVDPSTPGGVHRVLVVAMPGTSSVTVGPNATEIVVTVPALASKLEAATGAVDDRRADAEDVLRTFGADAIVVAGDAAVADQIRGRVTVPVSVG